MLDSLIAKWEGIREALIVHANYIEETGLIPNADVEGAPTTLDEARQGIYALLFSAEQMLNDLNILRIEQGLESVKEAEG